MRQHSSEISIEDHALEYGLSRNSIFFRIKETTMNHLYNSKLVQAMQFGQKLVVDCGYDQHMTERENGYTAKQLMFLFSENRIHAGKSIKNPFQLCLAYYLFLYYILSKTVL